MSLIAQLRIIRHFLKLSERDIVIRKGRAILTILGITIGIATLVSLMSVGLGMRQQVEEQLNELLGAGMMLQGSSTADVPEIILENVKSINYVSDAYPVIIMIGQIKTGACVFLGVPAEQIKNYLTGLQILEGRGFYPEEENVIVIQKMVSERLNLHPGDFMTIDIGNVGKRTFKIVGVFDVGTVVVAGQIGIIATNIKTAQKVLGREGYVSSIIVRVSDRSKVDYIEKILKEMFPNARITKQEEILKRINSIMDIINGVLIAIASISLLVAGLSIMNTIMMVVRERTREIGTLRAIGAKRWHVLAIFLSEAGILSLLGGIFGCILGVIGVYFIREFIQQLIRIQLLIVISPTILAYGIIIAITIGLLAGFQPSWKGANIRPIEALRYE